ncbi:hypothetical protein P3G55_00185 [Leptospira sp. 96542]|nr:hypothetical protein [Leptospira sp. 96542]
MFKFRFLSVFLVGLFLFSCATGVRSRSLLFRDNAFAVYVVSRNSIKLKSEELLPQKLNHPVEITEDKVLDLLGNIRFREESSYGNVNLFVFEEDEIKEFASDLVDGLQKVKPDQILLIVSKYNPIKSVVSHYSRTSFYIWSTENTIEIVFGELQREVTYEEQGNYYDWSNIPDISFDHVPEPDYILPGNGFQFKKVSGFKNKRWLEFNKKDLERLKFEKRKSKTKEISTDVEKDVNPNQKITKEDDELLND